MFTNVIDTDGRRRCVNSELISAFVTNVRSVVSSNSQWETREAKDKMHVPKVGA